MILKARLYIKYLLGLEEINSHHHDMYTCSDFKILASFCSWAGWFEFHRVIPEDIFSRDAAQTAHSANYRNDPKFWDRYAWANSADPDQTAPRGAVWSGSTLFAIPSASFGLITLW